MSARKTERLLNLVICLLSTRRYLSAERIREAVPGYAEDGPGGDDTAFRRMFERDKEELRELGIPIELGTNSVWDDEPGYRIASREYALPDIELTADEAAAVGLAARLWQSAGLASAASSALVKLRAAGIDTAPDRVPTLEPRVDAGEPAFPELLDAVRSHRPVTFRYRRSGSGPPQERTVEPWGLVSWHGNWYLAAHDRNRGEARIFRLSRVQGRVRFCGPAGTVTVPPDLDLRAMVSRLADEPPARTAVLRVRAGAGEQLRRAARTVRPSVGNGPASPGGAMGWDELELGFAEVERLADRVLGYGADVLVLEPPDAREAVLARLRAAAAPAGQTS
ncbi:MAG: WYL domain-containing protein [Actinomycetota bacterium]|nr:WYL domain-containing protein [Actinomycetota bacterium]